MIDPTSPKGRVMAAALRLAEAKPWCSVTLLDIGESAAAMVNRALSQRKKGAAS